MSLPSSRHLYKKIHLLLLAGLLLFPNQALPKNIDPQSPIRLVIRANYLKLLGETTPSVRSALNVKDLPIAIPTNISPKKFLSLDEFLRRVASGNQQVQIQKTEWGIRQADVESRRAIFEPELVTAFTLEERNQRNSVEESLNLQLASTYSTNNWLYDLSVQALTPTGGKFKLGYNLNKLANSQTGPLTGEDEEYQMSLGLNLRQPLLKNAGGETTKSGIFTAELESHAAFQKYRLELMQRVGKAAVTYWDYYQAQEQVNLRHDSLRIAEQIAADSRERQRTGKMAETEVLEAKVGVNSRASLLSEAEHVQRQVANRLGNLLSVKNYADSLNLLLVDSSAIEKPQTQRDDLFIQALKLRPEYLAALEKMKQADIKIAFAENQHRPELDLLASYGLNGLDFSVEDSWSQIQGADYASWSLGLEFRIPLRGGLAGRSELKKAQLEKRRQLLEIKDIEIELVNRIDTALDNVTKGADQLQYAEQNSEIQKQLLDTEIAKLRIGRSSSREVLEKEDRYRSARESVIKNQVKLQTALVELELSGGTILKNHGVDIMETGM